MRRPNRERTKRAKPIKKHRDGYTGERQTKNKERAKELACKNTKESVWTSIRQSKFLKKESTTSHISRESILSKFRTAFSKRGPQ